MLRCTSCDHEGSRAEFQGSESYACPKCGMDESGLVAVCETCGVEDSDLTLSDALHTDELCFK